MDRVFNILWGPTLENVLAFNYPMAGTNARHWREPREGSELDTNGASSIAWHTGRVYKMAVTAQYVGPTSNFGPLGLQSFLDWAFDGNVFTLVPDIAVPGLTVPGCYLLEPGTTMAPSVDQSGGQAVDLLIAHTTSDLGLAWRGLWFEYAAGGNLTDPVVHAYTRANIGYEVTWQGTLQQVASGVIDDGHYPDPMNSGLQTTLLSMAIQNDVLVPEDLSDARWLKNECTITANQVPAPDGATTADKVVESANPAAIHTCNCNPGNPGGITIVAGDVQTAVCFVREGGRFNGIVWFNDAPTGAGGNRFGVQFNLLTGVLISTTLGTAALTGSKITKLANGWWSIWIRGTLGGAITTSYYALRLLDDGGSGTYTGDGAKGMYFWGATCVHGAGATKLLQPLDYTPTSSAADTWTVPYTQAPQALWIYTKFIEGGTAPSNTSTGLFRIGVGSTPFTRFDTFGGTNRYRFSHQTAAVALSSEAAGSPVVGDLVEHLGIIYTDGSVEMRQSINGGAETSGGRTGAIPFGTAWSNALLTISDTGFTGALAVFRLGAGANITTIAAARGV